jgi:hypothetical protein
LFGRRGGAAESRRDRRFPAPTQQEASTKRPACCSACVATATEEASTSGQKASKATTSQAAATTSAAAKSPTATQGAQPGASSNLQRQRLQLRHLPAEHLPVLGRLQGRRVQRAHSGAQRQLERGHQPGGRQLLDDAVGVGGRDEAGGRVADAGNARKVRTPCRRWCIPHAAWHERRASASVPRTPPSNLPTHVQLAAPNPPSNAALAVCLSVFLPVRIQPQPLTRCDTRPSRLFRSGDWRWDTQDKLALDAAGWPTSLPTGRIAHTLTVREVPPYAAVPGRYVALWDGDGQVDVEFEARVSSGPSGAARQAGAATSQPSPALCLPAADP